MSIPTSDLAGAWLGPGWGPVSSRSVFRRTVLCYRPPMRTSLQAASIILALSIASPLSAGQIHIEQTHDGKTLALSGLFADQTCTGAQRIGRIVTRKFDSDGLTLDGIVLELGDGTRDFINVDRPDSKLNMARASAVYDGLQRLTRIGRIAHVRVLLCGAAGRVETLESIR